MHVDSNYHVTNFTPSLAKKKEIREIFTMLSEWINPRFIFLNEHQAVIFPH
jgi:hypothetical protein